jgi:DNA-binding CsgD family transcriptional regulator
MSRMPKAGATRKPAESRKILSPPNRMHPGSKILCDQAWRAIALSLRLSKRQIQIVRAIYDDATELAIAEAFGISAHTVHTHLDRIHKKLRVHSRVELVLLVFDEFLRLTVSGTAGLPPVCARHAQGKCPLRGKAPLS